MVAAIDVVPCIVEKKNGENAVLMARPNGLPASFVHLDDLVEVLVVSESSPDQFMPLHHIFVRLFMWVGEALEEWVARLDGQEDVTGG